ncbi:MAG TPA: hypothetical protein DCS30_05470 [Rhizobiales bacterium]|nr:hypothetical protein [Hyphomicrobiales bacterium]
MVHKIVVDKPANTLTIYLAHQCDSLAEISSPSCDLIVGFPVEWRQFLSFHEKRLDLGGSNQDSHQLLIFQPYYMNIKFI